MVPSCLAQILAYRTSVGRVSLAWEIVKYLRKLRLKYFSGSYMIDIVYLIEPNKKKIKAEKFSSFLGLYLQQ